MQECVFYKLCAFFATLNSLQISPHVTIILRISSIFDNNRKESITSICLQHLFTYLYDACPHFVNPMPEIKCK